MNGYWIYKTRFGTFSIRPHGERFSPFFEDESLGSYNSAQSALEDLAGGSTFWPSSGVDPSECGLPDELDDWTFVRRPL